MDFVDLLLKEHETLRASLRTMIVMLGRPSGVGWEDRMELDRGRFSLLLREFLDEFKSHEGVEDLFLTRVVRQLGLDRDLDAAISEGHRSLDEMTRLFEVIFGACDGEHAYSVRMVLGRLQEELERHLTYEETQVFPKLRLRLPAALLRELGRRAAAMERAGRKAAGSRPSAYA
ncbi:MAG: hypothetical protein ACHQ49_03165 [Elusimicrobiota bacterium]